ncbi:MAG TPA: T9SS type A sorting domain-containing protein [Chitinophagales bacterium]|nr:T9SS type A sorting domain-containing protein [Chitinophagales bacterium]
MKTIDRVVFVLALLLVGANSLKAQTDWDNIEKYWRYREKLTTKFTAVGDQQGESIIAGMRGRKAWLFPGELFSGFGDQTISLAQYIGMLATEYRILKDAGYNLDQTKEELFYAIESFNRLDYNAEKYFRGFSLAVDDGPEFDAYGNLITWDIEDQDLNGFFMRSDMFGEFLDTHPEITAADDQLDNGFVVNTVTSNHTDYPENDPSELCDPESGFPDYDSPTDYACRSGACLRTGEMSKDQVWWLFMGFALVKKCVDGGAGFAGHTFMDGETNFVAEVQRITDRIMFYARWSFDNDWCLKNPVTGNPVVGGAPPGGDIDPVNGLDDNGDCSCLFGAASFGDLKYGFAKAACYITDADMDKYLTTFQIGVGAFAWNNIGLFGVYSPYSYAGAFMCSTSNEYIAPLILAATGNIWTSSTISDAVEFVGMDNASIQTPFYSLLHGYLHNEDPYYSKAHIREDFIDLAPCKGPYNFPGVESPQMPNYEWSSTNMHVHPENRGDATPGEEGYYNGLDYMLLYNLYYLLYGEGDPRKYYNANFYEEKLDYKYDYITGAGTFVIGSHDVPREVDVFHTITTDKMVHPDGHLTYKAGDWIEMNPGFRVEEGGVYYAYIDEHTCTAGGSYERNDWVETREPKPNDASSLVTVYPNPSMGDFVFTVREGFDRDAEYSIQLTDLSGKTLDQLTQIKTQVIHYHSNLTPGIYTFLVKENGKNIFTGKLVKL